jgi:hypothetical protein
MIKHTGSSNRGHALCCKPGSTNEYCETGVEHTCSQPVLEKDTSSLFDGILTAGKNYQMFAFCPQINQKTCGISNQVYGDKDGSMVIKANEKRQTISTDQMLYRIGSPSYRKSDTCYYDIHSMPDTELKDVNSVLGLRIFMKVIKKKNVNVYLYGGRDRFNAVGNVVYGN